MVPERGILTLNPGSINVLKAKDRQAAQVLKEVGLVEIQWFKNEREIERFMCPSNNCQEMFFDLHVLKNHFFKTHNGRPFKCNFNNCKWAFATRSRLERHKNSHLNLKWFRCAKETCGKMFTTLYNLKQHLKTVHDRAEQFVCPINDCNAGFHNQRSLDLHKATHQNMGGSYSCEHEGCNKSFVTKNALCSHMKSHEHKLEDLKCSWKGCDKVFELPCRLREHMRTHTGDKPFRCDHPGCGWSFYTGSKLHRHRNKHLQIRKYVCCINHCNKSFLRSQHLKEHILTHSKNNTVKLSCPVEECDSTFGSKNLVYRHVKRVHRKETQTEESGIELNNYFEVKMFEAEPQEDQPKLINNQCIGQVDSITLLTGDYDVSSMENITTLNTNMPELISSELLVAMTSIESPNSDSLVDLTTIESCTNQSVVIMTPVETNNNETVVINDSNFQYVLDPGTLPEKYCNKRKISSCGSARTSYTYKDVMKEKNCKIEPDESNTVKWVQLTEAGSDELKPKKLKSVMGSTQPEDMPNCKVSVPSDLLLGAGLSDHHSLIIKDELYTQEDLQVLLLDQGTLKNSIFEPSTINLRDLE